MDKSESARKAAVTILDIVFASGIFIGPANMSKQNDILTSLATIIETHNAAYRTAGDALVEAVKYHLIHLKNVGLNLRDMLGDDEMKRFMHKPGMGEVMITSTKLSTALAAVEKAKEVKDGINIQIQYG